MFKRQYDIITKDRGKIETFVVGTLLKDLSLYMDFKLKDSDFIIDKTKFFFGLGRIASKTLNELDELSLYEIVNKEIDIKNMVVGKQLRRQWILVIPLTWMLM